MNKHFIRVVAFLLIPVLVSDPGAAAYLNAGSAILVSRPQQSLGQWAFQQQAVTQALDLGFTTFDRKDASLVRRQIAAGWPKRAVAIGVLVTGLLIASIAI